MSSNSRLAWKYATYYWRVTAVQRVYGSLDDVAQMAFLGLAKAAKGFNPAKAQFSTYAVWCIRTTILNGLAAGIIRIPNHALGAQGRLATGKRVKKKHREAAEHANRAMYAVQQFPEDVRAFEPPSGCADPCDEAAAREQAEQIGALLNKLPPQWREVLRLHYGIGCRPMNLREIGDHMGVTRQRIQQIEAEGLEKLRLLAIRKQVAG